jgi:hypothetical protein
MNCNDLTFNTAEQSLTFNNCEENLVVNIGSEEILANVDSVVVNLNGSAAPPRIYNENLNGLINGSNATFTTTNSFVQGSEEVKINGLTQRPTRDYTITPPDTIQFTSSPEPNDQLLISYNQPI